MATMVYHDADAKVGKKKRRFDGQRCGGPGCEEFLSSTWYAQGQCCAKADCKRFFGVAGTYQPKKSKHQSRPLADSTNGAAPAAARQPQQPQPQPQPSSDAAPESSSARVARQAAPGRVQDAPYLNIAGLQQRYGSGCYRHEGVLKSSRTACTTCNANHAAFKACCTAELAPYQRSVDNVRPVVQPQFLTATITFEEGEDAKALSMAEWARWMRFYVIDDETDDDVFKYEGPARDSFEVPLEHPGNTYRILLAPFASAAEAAVYDKLNEGAGYLDIEVLSAHGLQSDAWQFVVPGPAFAASPRSTRSPTRLLYRDP
jgi:hypothetical protein